MNDAASSASEFAPFLRAMFGLVFLAFLASSLAGWVCYFLYFNKVRTWRGWLPDQPIARVGLIDLLVFFACIVVTQIPVAIALRPFIPREVQSVEVQVSSESEPSVQAANATHESKVPAWIAPVLTLSYLMAFVLSAFLLLVRTGSTLQQLGIVGGERLRNVAVGLAAFVLATPPILTLSGIVTSMTDVEYDHPVLKSMRENPWTFPLLFFGAVVCAPLWEEYAFRGLLIRWLDSIRFSRGDLRVVFLGRSAERTDFRDGAIEDSASQPVLDSTPTIPEAYPPWWPAIVSGLVFGLAHFPYGVSWVPLILFGVVSARLFQLRRSILPCVVLHVCFNSLSMLGLGIRVFSGE